LTIELSETESAVISKQTRADQSGDARDSPQIVKVLAVSVGASVSYPESLVGFSDYASAITLQKSDIGLDFPLWR
jgi:hypothetical protein